MSFDLIYLLILFALFACKTVRALPLRFSPAFPAPRRAGSHARLRTLTLHCTRCTALARCTARAADALTAWVLDVVRCTRMRRAPLSGAHKRTRTRHATTPGAPHSRAHQSTHACTHVPADACLLAPCAAASFLAARRFLRSSQPQCLRCCVAWRSPLLRSPSRRLRAPRGSTPRWTGGSAGLTAPGDILPPTYARASSTRLRRPPAAASGRRRTCSAPEA